MIKLSCRQRRLLRLLQKLVIFVQIWKIICLIDQKLSLSHLIPKIYSLLLNTIFFKNIHQKQKKKNSQIIFFFPEIQKMLAFDIETTGLSPKNGDQISVLCTIDSETGKEKCYNFLLASDQEKVKLYFDWKNILLK